MNPIDAFQEDVARNIRQLRDDRDIHALSRIWSRETNRYNYTYNFAWLGRPIIQYPQDVFAMQELIWDIRPDLIIETGIAHGGSIIFSASMLAMLDMTEAIEEGRTIDPAQSKRRVLGIDLDIRDHNRAAIDAHPMASRIHMIEGSSIAADTIRQVDEFAADYQRVLICFDSNHTHEHVLAELQGYQHLVQAGSYIVVFDGLIEYMPRGSFPDRPWEVGDNPLTAVHAFLKENDRFEIDRDLEAKLSITVAPDGYLKCVKDS